MRNTESGPNTSFTISLSSRALARSWPNGFSITTRRHGRWPSGPSAGVGQAGPLELRHHVGEELRRDRQVEGVVAAGAALGVELRHGLGEPVEGVVVGELAGHEPDPLGQLLPDGVAERGPRVLLDRVVGDLREVLVLPVPAGEADQGEARRQQPAVGQVVDGRHQLLAGQVAGDAEQDQHARARRPGGSAGPGDPAAG